MNDRWQKAIDAVAACGIASRGQHDGLSIASPPGWVIVDASSSPARILAAFTIPSSEGDGGRAARLASATALRSTPIRATWEGDVLNLEATVFEGSADTLTMYATDLVRTALSVAGVDAAIVSSGAAEEASTPESAEPRSWETPAEPLAEPAGDPAAAWSAPAAESAVEPAPVAWEEPAPAAESQPEAPAASSEPAAWQPPSAEAAAATPSWQAPAATETPSWQAPAPGAAAEEAAVPPDPFAPPASTAPAGEPEPEPAPTPTYQSTMSYEAAALQGAIQPGSAAQPAYQQQAAPSYEEGTPVTEVVWVYVESQQPAWQNARPDAAQAAPVQPGRWYQLLRTLGDWSQVQGEGETPKWVDGRNLRRQ